VKGFENEPEGGKRCPICFQMRLEKTADLAKSSGALYFATTLAISPFKNEAVINEIAQEVAKDKGLIFYHWQILVIKTICGRKHGF